MPRSLTTREFGTNGILAFFHILSSFYLSCTTIHTHYSGTSTCLFLSNLRQRAESAPAMHPAYLPCQVALICGTEHYPTFFSQTRPLSMELEIFTFFATLERIIVTLWKPRVEFKATSRLFWPYMQREVS